MQSSISSTNDKPEELSEIIDIVMSKLNLTSMKEVSGGYTHQTYLGTSVVAGTTIAETTIPVTTVVEKKFLIKIAIKPIQNEVIANKFFSKIGIKNIPNLIESFLVNDTQIVV